MILRRITSHVREQNWTAIAIDFVIVVVGVFLGIQLGDWNDERADRADEAVYLGRLLDDLEKTEGRLESDMEWQLETANALAVTLTALRQCELADADKDIIAQGLYRAGKLGTEHFTDTTIEELRSSGRMNVIRNEEIRRDLIELDRRFERSGYYMETIGEWAIKPVNAVHSRTVFLNVDFEDSVFRDVTWNQIEFDFASACQDDRFVGDISALRQFTHDNLRFNRGLLDGTQSLMQKIEATR